LIRAGVEVGRFSAEQLRQLSRTGQLQGTDEVEEVGSAKRRRADQIAGLGLNAPVPHVRQRSVAAPPAAPVSTFPQAAGHAPSPGDVEHDPFVFVTNPHAPSGQSPRSSGRPQSASGVLPLVAVLGGLVLVGALGLGALLLFTSNFSPFQDRYVTLVKNGRLEGCPHRTVGDMTSGFLTRPRWRSLVADDGNRYVNCRGGLTFKDAPAIAELQFAILGQSNFQLRSLEINGVPQPLLVQAVLMKKMCEE
jgi:hypothetical protein